MCVCGYKLGREAERRHRERQRYKTHRETGIDRRKTRKEGRDWQVGVERRLLLKTETDRYMFTDLHFSPHSSYGFTFLSLSLSGGGATERQQEQTSLLPSSFPSFHSPFVPRTAQVTTAFGLAWGQGEVGSLDCTGLSVMLSLFCGLKMGLSTKQSLPSLP